MDFLIPLFLMTSSFSAHGLDLPPCPDGSSPVGGAPPVAEKYYCVTSVDDRAVLNGPYLTFYPNGLLRQRADYLNGKLHGRKEDWGIRGNLLQVWHYEMGLPHGVHEIYGANGQVRVRKFYERGTLAEGKPTPHRGRKSPRAVRPALRLEKPKQSSRPLPSPAPKAPPTEKPAQIATSTYRCRLEVQPEDQISLDNLWNTHRQEISDSTHGQLELEGAPDPVTLTVVKKDDSRGGTLLQFKMTPTQIKYRLKAASVLGGLTPGDPAHQMARDLSRKANGVLNQIRDVLVHFETGWNRGQERWMEVRSNGNPVPSQVEWDRDGEEGKWESTEFQWEGKDRRELEVQNLVRDPAGLPSAFEYSLDEGGRGKIQMTECTRTP